MIVMKFGGSSVANADRIRHVADIVKSRLDRKPVLVLSAMGDTTDHLLEAGALAIQKGVVELKKIEELHLKTIRELGLGKTAQKDIEPLMEKLRNLLMGISLIKELTDRTKDYLVSFGERLSVRIAAAYFNSIGVNAQALDAWDVGFLSDSNYTHAEVKNESYKIIPSKLLPGAEKGLLQIVTGFIAKDDKGYITTLGRGGSDLTVSTIGAACKAEEVQFWKDVDGILSADPRIAKDAHPVEVITYEAAS